ncbi:hypothetical protein BN8_02109 [Fibrisoma limi BUZ 3]|uniref:Ig-like domain-containing protein n=2 Tax=Fibrisoma limi TaxID=663275 RepID=I2GGM2_9BACT|nr:hypothetical protein BN8_02109 [Fibrisoma limi BUZ 3]
MTIPLLCLTLLTALLPLSGWAQCPTGKIILSTQADVDAFPPGCVNLPGALEIRGPFISNLNSLSGIQSVNGNLDIRLSPGLTSVDGFNNLTTITGSLTIDECVRIENLFALSKLTSIGGNLRISNCGSLLSLGGLNNLTNIPGNLTLFFNDDLETLGALNKVTQLTRVFIDNNPRLSNLEGLNNLTTVSQALVIHTNGSLTSLTALNKLTSIGHLAIFDNTRLSECAITAFCQYLAQPSGSVEINNNAPGCSSIADVQADCNPLTITTQPPSSSTVCPGATVTVGVATSGNVRTYQWYRNGQVIAGQTSSTLSLANVQPWDTGAYVVVASNSVSTLTSTTFNLMVNPNPSVSISPSATAICQGQTARFTASGADTYQWQGPDNFTSSTNPVTVTLPGTYTVTGTNDQGCSASASTTLIVNPIPNPPTVKTPSGQPGQLYPAGQSTLTVPQYSGTVTLLIEGCPGAISWTGPDGTTGLGTTITVPTIQTGTLVYQATCQVSSCVSEPAFATIIVQAQPLKLLVESYDCASRQLTLRSTGGNGQPVEYHINSVTNGWESMSNRFVLESKHLGRALKLRARQRNTSGGWNETDLSFTPKACGARQGVVEAVDELQVVVLGNPVVGESVEVDVRGAQGQPLNLQVVDQRGRLVDGLIRPVAQAVEVVRLRVGEAAGLYLLQVATPTQRQTLKIQKQ